MVFPLKYLALLQTYSTFENTLSEHSVMPDEDMTITMQKDMFDSSIDIDKVEETFGTRETSKRCGSDIEHICRLKKIVKTKLEWEGNSIIDRKYDFIPYLDIIDQARKNGDSLNCRYKSYIFSQLLMAYGYKARWVGCLPMDFRDSECHCVTEVFLKSLNKWIVVDIAFDYLYFDNKGNLLNLIEMRRKIIAGEKIRFLSMDSKKASDTKKYLEKNLFKFRFASLYRYNLPICSVKPVLLVPKHYILADAEKKMYANITNNVSMFWK